MKYLFTILVMVFLVGCGPSTSITGSWKNDADLSSKSYNSVFIVALTRNVPARTLVEDELAYYAEKNGFEVHVSHEVFPGKFSESTQPSKEQVMKAIRETGSNAIFSITLMDKESEQRYVPGNTNYAYGYAPYRYGYYGNFYGYYNAMYPVTYNPGYYTTDKIYYIESNLYDAETENLLWSAQSKTYNPSSLESFVQDYSEVLVKKLISDGILKE
ncbi:hypothetical protein [Robertkochia aurantiaca]|uniref:hypothetical protein n=1 Tax=Robertkochia aurantiaca TaxID=2873700 RepID=UPI001CCD82D5|nr:hypothetical protein [Robertkochia sp. 3YJGBD-33]